MTDFYQTAPTLGNQYAEDHLLRALLQRQVPPEVLTEIEPGLRQLGQRAVTDIWELGRAAEAQPPRHVPYDPWGRRIDHIEVSTAWQQLDRISAEEGLVALGYERAHGQWSRVHQFARLHLFGPSSAIYTCPLAMTDGAARLIEIYGDTALQARALPHLLARDPAQFWTAGQWMTERTGGSDVSGTSTVARLEDGQYRLYGDKWFTSATTSQIALTLARLPDAPAGSRGLSTFYLELRDAAGQLQNIFIRRLKDKLGTHALPTAELTLQGTPAQLVGEPGHGVRTIATILNITRAYNAGSAVSFMRRALALARAYAHQRTAFGALLAQQPLHLETLSALQVEYAGALQLVFHLVELLGKAECGVATSEEHALSRLLTPLAKLYTAKQAIALISETLEAFGGAGYVEDTGLPVLLRDAQVLSIWEGTTNVLSLDVLRAIEKENALSVFLASVRERLAQLTQPTLAPSLARVQMALTRVEVYIQRGLAEGKAFFIAGARGLAYSLTRLYIASLLLEHAAWELQTLNQVQSLHIAQRWCAQDLAPLIEADPAHQRASQALALDEELLGEE